MPNTLVRAAAEGLPLFPPAVPINHHVLAQALEEHGRPVSSLADLLCRAREVSRLLDGEPLDLSEVEPCEVRL